jgi:hypothetical protein
MNNILINRGSIIGRGASVSRVGSLNSDPENERLRNELSRIRRRLSSYVTDFLRNIGNHTNHSITNLSYDQTHRLRYFLDNYRQIREEGNVIIRQWIEELREMERALGAGAF